MKLHKFLAPDARRGLEIIRQTLGPDAMVVTSRKTADGVEFVAGRFGELEDVPEERSGRNTAAEGEGGIKRELVKLRALLQNQLAGLTWGMEKRRHPVRVQVMQRLLNAGFSPKLSRLLAARLPKQTASSQANAWLRQVLIRNLAVADKTLLPGTQPGIWALVGPTGHGKTTTLAKLAAQAVLQHGPNNVALVSMDTYRIGAQQQLNTYADMMGVDCILLPEAQQLAETLTALKAKRCVLIDTAGFGHADPRLGMQLETLAAVKARCLLTLAISTQGPLASRIFQRYSAIALAGAMLTKLDEGGLWAPVLDCLMRAKLPVVCLASGQRVPEDLHGANPAYLIDRALRSPVAEEFAIRPDDWPVLAGAHAEAAEWREAGRG